MEFVSSELARIERGVKAGSDRTTTLRELRVLGLDDFGELMFSVPLDAYPALSQILPSMASEQVQKNWTGSSGTHLLMQTLDFVRSICYNFSRFTGQSLEDKNVLDFGCGYGRIARLVYHFVDPARLYGVDPWDESIRLCHSHGLIDNFLQSEYLPTDLPTGTTQFSLIYAFSVFTHLSERATRQSIDCLLKQLAPGGVLVITIRPVEYWQVDQYAVKENRMTELTDCHHDAGFAFLPHQRQAIDGDITYGDTSMSLDWIAKSFPQASLYGIDRSLKDPYQIYVFLGHADPSR